MEKQETLQDILGESSIPQESDSITRVAVIGAGQMGQGIAWAISAKGLDVLLVERDEASLAESLENLARQMDNEIARWGMTESDKRAILSRIRGTVDSMDVAEYRIIIEAVPEEMPIKKSVISRIDAMAGREAIFITNTSTLSVTEIAQASAIPERVIGMHFLHPVPKKPLAEIVRGLKTSDTTFETAKMFAEDIGKKVVEVYESPGFVTTRLILPMLNEAMHVLMEGVATVDGIDDAMRYGYDFDQGPLALADQMGLDQVWHWLEEMFHETGDQKYRPCPLLRKLVRAGHFGVKTGEGFYHYNEHGRRQAAAVSRGI